LAGVAWTRDEFADGIASAAAPVSDEDGEVVAAVHVHGPSYRFPAPGEDESIARQVTAAATRISSAIRQAS
ncbi:MAG TPA: IclR family transcriptional regulator C-terminal domain-containing protein, partial [Vitreimonas sp.]|nr:IclR family transcriptional regulator C-terminal domain-containing protein [Vitreimonas sp.]